MAEQTCNSSGEIDRSELFRLLVESATDFAIFTIDPAGRVTSWNPGAERLLGYAQDEIIGKSADVIFTLEDQADGIPGLERREATAHGKAVDERWTLRRDGSRFWASGLLMPLAAPGEGYVKIFRDQTPRRRMEALLREREERFRLLATNIPQLVFRTRPDGHAHLGQPAMDRLHRPGSRRESRVWLARRHSSRRSAGDAGRLGRGPAHRRILRRASRAPRRGRRIPLASDARPAAAGG